MPQLFDHAAFFDAVRTNIYHGLSQSQVAGCEAILNEAERRGLGKPETAYIYKNNILAEKVSLKTDGIIRLEKMAFEVKSGRIRVSESDCKNHVCMEEGWIMNPGQSIVCLPNRVVVEIPAGSGDSKYDILSE